MGDTLTLTGYATVDLPVIDQMFGTTESLPMLMMTVPDRVPANIESLPEISSQKISRGEPAMSNLTGKSQIEISRDIIRALAEAILDDEEGAKQQTGGER